MLTPYAQTKDGNIRVEPKIERIDEAKEHLKNKIRLVVRAINDCFLCHEYTRYHCDGCPMNVLRD